MIRKLFLTYTQELTPYAAKVREAAKKADWEVRDGPAEYLYSLDKQVECAVNSDAVMVLSAYAYGGEPGKSQQETIWDIAKSKRKWLCALLARGDFPVSLVEWERLAALKEFQQKLRNSPFVAEFGVQVESITDPVNEQLRKLELEISTASQKKVFVVWDFSTAGLPLLLEALKRRPPQGFTITVPGVDAAAGEIFRNIVLPGITNSDRVLIVTDKPNANVAFEAGVALGLGKPIALVHFGPAIPGWLEQSLFKGFIVNTIQTLEDLRSKIINEDCWFPPPPAAPAPDHGPTLFLAPGSFVGAALHELQAQQFPYWKKPPKRANFNDISDAFADIGHVVWALASYPELADIRDGSENSANAVIAGWFYARAHASQLDKRVSFLRQKEARVVLDVQVPEATFHDVDSFSNLLKEVPDRRLPPPEALQKRNFGPNKIAYPMIRIPNLGSREIWVGVHPVTIAQYRAFRDAKKQLPKEPAEHLDPSYWPEDLDDERLSNFPVVNVSLQEADEFCRWAGLDLPTPELWRKAALAGSSGKYWWGDDESPIVAAAWFLGNSENRRHDVCTRSANRWGLFDVLGNVWEWTRVEERERGPYGDVPTIKALPMGGAFNSSVEDLSLAADPFFIENRENRMKAVERNMFTGFRCIRYVP
jgi:Sulfatase-modifying factor enzyme 1